MKCVYIAAPLSAGDPAKVKASFDAYLQLCAAVTASMPLAVLSWAGHAEAHRRGHAPLPSAQYLRRDFALIEKADEVWFACDPFTANSVGMIAEYAVAQLTAGSRLIGVRLQSLHQPSLGVRFFPIPVWEPANAPWLHPESILEWAATAYTRRAAGETWMPEPTWRMP